MGLISSQPPIAPRFWVPLWPGAGHSRLQHDFQWLRSPQGERGGAKPTWGWVTEDFLEEVASDDSLGSMQAKKGMEWKGTVPRPEAQGK